LHENIKKNNEAKHIYGDYIPHITLSYEISSDYEIPNHKSYPKLMIDKIVHTEYESNWTDKDDL
jgi:hypothetical protein